MKIQYCSDLHLEFPENQKYLMDNPIEVKGDILILAGDITLFNIIDDFRFFFDFVSKNFKYTYWIPGNHEYYYYDIAKKPNLFKEQIRKNVYLVNNIAVIHEDIKLIFSTLWSNITPANSFNILRSLSDFRVISNKGKSFTVDKYNSLHKRGLKFLEKEIKLNTHKKTVVITHHAPTFMNYPEQYKGSPINDAFATELFDFIENCNANYWIYGHTHGNVPNFNIGNTILTTNQLGYIRNWENENFDGGKFFEL